MRPTTTPTAQTTPTRTPPWTTWTPAPLLLWPRTLVDARRIQWAAAATRLATTLPADDAFQPAVERAVGFTLAALQQQMCDHTGPAPVGVRAPLKKRRDSVTHGSWVGVEEVIL